MTLSASPTSPATPATPALNPPRSAAPQPGLPGAAADALPHRPPQGRVAPRGAWAGLLRATGLLRRGLSALQPAAQLAARGYVALVFFRSGLTKLRDWEVTLALFQDEYQVPLLPPALAAWLGTGGELLLPLLLVAGLAGRFAAAGLSVVNAVAVASLPVVAEAALQQHVFWASLLLGLLLWGPGAWSLDALWWPRLLRRLGGDGR